MLYHVRSDLNLTFGELKESIAGICYHANYLYIPVYNWQGAVWPVKACVSLRIGRSQIEVPDVEMGVH